MKCLLQGLASAHYSHSPGRLCIRWFLLAFLLSLRGNYIERKISPAASATLSNVAQKQNNSVHRFHTEVWGKKWMLMIHVTLGRRYMWGVSVWCSGCRGGPVTTCESGHWPPTRSLIRDWTVAEAPHSTHHTRHTGQPSRLAR